MAYFHSRWVRNRAGTLRRPMRRLIGETVEEMVRVGREWPEATTINWPPRSRDSWKSKSIPSIWLDANRDDILAALDSSEVSDEHLAVLTMMIREEFYGKKVGHTSETRKFFQREIRGKLIQLLRMGEWIDEPETLGLKKLNYRLEKIDLGRRKDLNFSREQSEIQKYDRDAHRTDMDEPEVDWKVMYRDGTKEVRREILHSRPWMKTQLETEYGSADDGKD